MCVILGGMFETHQIMIGHIQLLQHPWHAWMRLWLNDICYPAKDIFGAYPPIYLAQTVYDKILIALNFANHMK